MRPKGFFHLSCFLLLMLVAATSSGVRPRGFDESIPHTYSIQLAAGDSRDALEAKAEEFRALGLSEIRVEEDESGIFRVFQGNYVLYADAMIVKNCFRASGIAPDAFLKEYEIAEVDLDASQWQWSPVAGLPESMRLFSAILYQENNRTSVSERGEYSNLEAIDKSGTDADYRSALLGQSGVTPATDPLGGYIEVNLAILDIKAGDNESALPHLMRILEGNVASTRVHQIMALRRYAWVKHQLGDRQEAYRAYCELYDLAAGSASRSTALVDRLGLLMEFAESVKGTHYEVRAAKAAWQPLLPPKAYSNRATMDLIEQESWFRQRRTNPAKAQQLAIAMVRRYENLGDERPNREYFTALFQAGYFSDFAHEEDKSVYYYERLLDEIEGVDAEWFARSNPKANALIGLSRLASHNGDMESRDEFIQMVVDRYPQTDLAKKILIKRARAEAYLRDKKMKEEEK